VTTQAMTRRVGLLEAFHGGSSACPRCSGTLIVVRDAITREFHSARSLPGGELSAEELLEHETERRCPRCGRERDENEGRGLVIKIGGRK
jgi:predicted RNA-binding Zn-ribbon protein involved in translation (DUF1610 family)